MSSFLISTPVLSWISLLHMAVMLSTPPPSLLGSRGLWPSLLVDRMRFPFIPHCLEVSTSS